MAYCYKKLKINGKCIDEHRHVWMQHYGEIPKGYVIHHKDGNKMNNDISNLELKPMPLHTREHFKGIPLVERFTKEQYEKWENSKRGGRPKVGPDGTAWCNKCKEFKPIEDFGKNKNNFNGLQNQCKDCRRLRNKKKGKEQ